MCAVYIITINIVQGHFIRNFCNNVFNNNNGNL